MQFRVEKPKSGEGAYVLIERSAEEIEEHQRKRREALFRESAVQVIPASVTTNVTVGGAVSSG
jgi:hypothetical protein